MHMQVAVSDVDEDEFYQRALLDTQDRMTQEEIDELDREQYVKMRRELIDQQRLGNKSLMFGMEEILEHRGHAGQEVISVVENHNNK